MLITGLWTKRIMKLFMSTLILQIFFAHRVSGQIHYRVILQSPFQTVGKINIDYPEELKEMGTASRFLLSVHLKKDGSVLDVFIWKSHFPKLNDRIKQAVSLMKFEPFLYKGKPMKIHGFMKVIFYPEREEERTAFNAEYASAVDSEKAFCSRELRTILDACSDYCRRLSIYALSYTCIEAIDENCKDVVDEFVGNLSSEGGPDLISNEYITAPLYQLMLKNSEKRAYLFDYQLIRKKGEIFENRHFLGRTGSSIQENKNFSGGKLSYHLQPVMAPLQFLSDEKQAFYNYQSAGFEKVMGKRALILKISPKCNRGDIFHGGRVWLAEDDYRILKMEIKSIGVDGFQEVYDECSKHFLTPLFSMTHFYAVEKNGILFPSRSEVRIDYFGLLSSQQELKSQADIKYSSYRFFSVEVDHEIIKHD